MTHPLLKLSELGQSLWLDYISRRILEDGSLAGLVRAGKGDVADRVPRQRDVRPFSRPPLDPAFHAILSPGGGGDLRDLEKPASVRHASFRCNRHAAIIPNRPQTPIRSGQAVRFHELGLRFRLLRGLADVHPRRQNQPWTP